MFFKDRIDAAQQLAKKLAMYRGSRNAIVLGLPRGGVPVAAVIAKALELPLDIIVVRKIGAPHNPELAIGAITEGGTALLDELLVAELAVSKEYITQETARQQAEATRRLKKYRGKKPPLDLSGKIALLVDDGIATGATMKAAIASAKSKGATKIVVAIPLAPPETVQALAPLVDEIISLHTPSPFGAIGAFYRFCPQVVDNEVIALLAP